MPHTLPYLVEQVLPEAAPALEQRLELRRLWVADERRHRAQGYRRLPSTESASLTTRRSRPSLPAAADPAQRSDQPHVPDSMRELRPPRRLQERQ